MCRNETPGQIVTNFCTGVGVHDVITSANFYDCRLSGLSWGWGVGQILGFSIDLHRRTTVRVCDLVQNTNTTLSTHRNGQIHIIWKSKMVAAAILNFGKMTITPDWIKISVPYFMWRCMRRWPRDQKSKPEVNSCDVIKWTIKWTS